MVSKEVLADVVPNVSVDVVSKEEKATTDFFEERVATREGQGAEARTYPRRGLAEAVAHTSS